MGAIETQLAGLREATKAAEAANEELSKGIQAHKDKEARALAEATAARDELKRLRKDMLRLKDEWSTLRSLYEAVKVWH